MGQLVCNGAQLMCSFGTAPAAMIVPPQARTFSGTPAACIMDFKPGANIPPFAMCTSMSNPAVASATAAAFGVLTPQPCTLVPTGPWKPGCPKSLIGGQPALENTCTLQCAWGGVITITSAGQTKVMVQ